MKETLDLTIAIPVLNEERNLPDCLNSIGLNFAQHIVVIDSGSSDNTCMIANDFGAELIHFKWDGQFPKKRNWYLRNFKPKTKWILFLDADEYLTENFKNELREKLPFSSNVGYWLRYSIYFLGKQLLGGYPLEKLALFQVNAGEYEYINENQWSHLDMEIHEHPILSGGDLGNIYSKIDHRDYRGISHYINKHNEYANWEAFRYIEMRSNLSLWKSFTLKQKIKYRLINTPLLGPLFFFGSFFMMIGFRDGVRGFSFAIIKASYFIQIYCKIKELDIDKNTNN